MTGNAAAVKAWFNNPASGSGVYHRSFLNLCQAFLWRIADAFGSPAAPHVYASAADAAKASGTLNKDWAAAPAGAVHYWIGGNLGPAGHDGGDLEGGGTHVIYATGRKVAGAEDWGYDVKVGSVPAYTATGAVYAGWALHNGVNTLGLVPSNTLSPTQRKTLATGKVNRRVGPGTHYAEVVPQNDLAANTLGNFVAFAHSPASRGGIYNGVDLWYEGISGDWFWAGGFTTISGDGLVDKSAQFADTPAPPVIVPPVTPIWNVEFDAVGGLPIPDAQRVTDGALATMPAAPSRDQFTFAGWTNGGAAYLFSTPVHEDLALTAGWTPVPVVVVPPPVDSGDSGADSGTPVPPDSGADSGAVPPDSGDSGDSGADPVIPKPTASNIRAILAIVGAVLAAIAALIFGH
jgi:uncharacterized repeat protein (TIGR02543 family)